MSEQIESQPKEIKVKVNFDSGVVVHWLLLGSLAWAIYTFFIGKDVFYIDALIITVIVAILYRITYARFYQDENVVIQEYKAFKDQLLQTLEAKESELATSKEQLEQASQKASSLEAYLAESQKTSATRLTRINELEKTLEVNPAYERQFHEAKNELEQYRNKFIKEQRTKEHLEKELEELKDKTEINLSHAQLIKYMMVQPKWQLSSDNKRFKVFTGVPDDQGEPIELFIPACETLDFKSRVPDIINLLVAVEERSMTEIIRDIKKAE